MKNSHTSTGTSSALLRLTRWIFPALLVGSMAIGCGPQGPQGGQAPANPFGSPGPQGTPAPQGTPMPQGSQGPQGPQAAGGLVGQWRTTLQSGTMTLTIAASGQYMQVGQVQGGMQTQTMQSGPYQLTAPNTIHFTVTDWSPKTRWIFVPNPRCGVPGVPNPTNPQRDSCHQEQEWTMPQPPGSTYAYTFSGTNSMTLNNENAQEQITFTRVAGQ
jgi:hypothetical protein